MKNSTAILIVAVAFTLTACGSSFEWFPSADTTPPVITTTIGGIVVFNNTSTTVAGLPLPAIFTANEKATIYYTTDGITAPTTATTTFVNAPANTAVDGPTLPAATRTILKFIGVDTATNASATQTIIIKP